MTNGFYEIHMEEDKDVILASYKIENKKLIGIFNVNRQQGEIVVDVDDGKYVNLTDDSVLVVNEGKLELHNKAVIFELQ